MKNIIKFIGITFLLIICIYIYARYIEPNFLVVHYENISNSLINTHDKDLKILQFSDTHISENFDEKDIKKVVERINEEKPDIVFFTGDLFDEYNSYEKKDSINIIWETLSLINAPLGKYAIYGNHDYGGGAEHVYKKVIENSGFKLLKNEKVILSDYNINIIGLDDAIFGNIEKDKIIPMLEKDKYNIVLGHEPDIIDSFLEYDIDLFLAGHSHGGQVNIPFIDSLPILAKKYVRGIYNFDNFRQTILHVNIGLGTSQVPFRFMATPELSVIFLDNK